MSAHEPTMLPPPHEPRATPMTRFRWVILALVFAGTTINYLDRQVLALIAPDLQAKYHISESQYGRITAAFSFTYAAGQLISGGMLDKIGTRLGYALAVAAWSVCSIAHALVRSALGFGVVRSLLGLTESPAFPAATKVIAEWFPRRERATAMGFVNVGTSLGIFLVPVVVPPVVALWGLQSAFVITGAAGLLWLAFWFPVYRRPHEHRSVSSAELAHILSDPPEGTAKIPWTSLLRYRQAWAFIASKFITDSMWSFFIFFAAKFFATRFGLDLKHLGLPMAVVYFMAGLGSIGGGHISSTLLRWGWSLNAARKTALILCALTVTPVCFATVVPNVWVAALLVGLAMASHQGFSSNQYTLVSDLFPRRVVGSVSGMGGSCGYLGATILSLIAGRILDRTHGNYLSLFIVAASAYMVAFAIIHLCSPRLQPAAVDGRVGA